MIPFFLITGCRWLVDIDFYYSLPEKSCHLPEYISAALVQIGISESQVTRSSFGKPEIEIPERFMLFEKMEPESLNNIMIFDSWWRFIRNLKIRDESKNPGERIFGKNSRCYSRNHKVSKTYSQGPAECRTIFKIFYGNSFFSTAEKKIMRID